MRRFILFIIAVVALSAGAYLLYYEVFVSEVILSRLLIASAVLMTVGMYCCLMILFIHD